MKSIINKISRALQVVLLAPIKLPGKALNILKYVAVGLGIIESVLENGKPEDGSSVEGQRDTNEDSEGKDNGTIMSSSTTAAAASTGVAHPRAEVNLDDDASVVPEQVVQLAQSDIVRPNTAAETEERDE